MRWPHGLDSGRERAPHPAVHDESGSAFGGVEGHAASSGGLGGAGWRRQRGLVTDASGGFSPTSARCQMLVRCRGQGGGDREHSDTAALARSTSGSEENDSALKCSLNFTEPEFDNALQVFDRKIWQ